MTFKVIQGHWKPHGSVHKFILTSNRNYSCCSFYWTLICCSCFLPFPRFSNLLDENREIFIPLLYLKPPLGVIPSEFR